MSPRLQLFNASVCACSVCALAPRTQTFSLPLLLLPEESCAHTGVVPTIDARNDKAQIALIFLIALPVYRIMLKRRIDASIRCRILSGQGFTRSFIDLRFGAGLRARPFSSFTCAIQQFCVVFLLQARTSCLICLYVAIRILSCAVALQALFELSRATSRYGRHRTRAPFTRCRGSHAAPML